MWSLDWWEGGTGGSRRWSRCLLRFLLLLHTGHHLLDEVGREALELLAPVVATAPALVRLAHIVFEPVARVHDVLLAMS